MVIHVHNILSEMLKIMAGPLAKELLEIKDALSLSAKFNLGMVSETEFSPLVDTGFEYLREGLLPLPYPKTYFEFTEKFVEGYGERWWGVLIHPDAVFLGSYAVRVFGGRSEKGPTNIEGVFLDPALCPRPYRLVLSICKEGHYHFSEFQAVTASPPHLDWSQEAEKTVAELALCSGLALLSSPAVTTEVIPAPGRLNKRRLKKGKLPLFSYHVLRISGRSVSGGLIAPGNKRASPRRHWRRGHVRVYRRGETSEAKTIIPPALIGHRGFVGKDYDLSRAAASQLSPSKEP